MAMRRIEIINMGTSIGNCVENIIASRSMDDEAKKIEVKKLLAILTRRQMLRLSARYLIALRPYITNYRANGISAETMALHVYDRLATIINRDALRPSVMDRVLNRGYQSIKDDVDKAYKGLGEEKALYIKNLYRYRGHMLDTATTGHDTLIEFAYRDLMIVNNNVRVSNIIVIEAELVMCEHTVTIHGAIHSLPMDYIESSIDKNKSALRMYLKIVYMMYAVDRAQKILDIIRDSSNLAKEMEMYEKYDYRTLTADHEAMVNDIKTDLQRMMDEYQEFVDNYKRLNQYTNSVPLYTESPTFIEYRTDITGDLNYGLDLIQYGYDEVSKKVNERIQKKREEKIAEFNYRTRAKKFKFSDLTTLQFDPRQYIDTWTRELSTYGLIVLPPAANYDYKQAKLEMLDSIKRNIPITPDTPFVARCLASYRPYFEKYFDSAYLDSSAQAEYTKSIKSRYVDRVISDDVLEEALEDYHTDQARDDRNFSTLQGIIFLTNSGPDDSGFSYLERSTQSFSNYMDRTPLHGYRNGAINIEDVLYKKTKKIKLCIKAGYIVIYDARLINMMMENKGNPCLSIKLTMKPSK